MRSTVGDSRPGLLNRLLVVAAYGYGLAGMVAILAWTTAGDQSWTLPINATTFWWSLPGVVLVAVALLARSWRAVIPLAVPALLFLWAYGGLFVGAPPPGEPDLRIATYNTFIQAPDVSHVVSVVQEEQPDVLLLQEVQPARADQLRAQLGEHYLHSAFEHREAGRIGGVAVMSRYPIVEQRELQPLADSRPTRIVVIEARGERVQVVPVHLTSPCPLCGDSVFDRQAFEASRRHEEMEAIIAALDPELPVIIGGDFNSTRRSDPYRLLTEAGFRDPQIEAGSGPGFTWPDGSGPFFRIDWVMVRGLTPLGAWVAPPRASDHRPVVVDVALDTVPSHGDGQAHEGPR